jgi:hypothetical protein
MASSVPMINQRYQDLATNRTFEVLSVDEYLTVIDLHYDDGELDQISLDDWSQMVVTPPSERYNQAAALAIEDHQGQMPWATGLDDAMQSDYMFGWDEF